MTVKDSVSVDPSFLDSSSLHEFDGVVSLDDVQGHLLHVQGKINYVAANLSDSHKLVYCHYILVRVPNCNPDT